MNVTCLEAFTAYAARVRMNDALSDGEGSRREQMWYDMIACLGVFNVKVRGRLGADLVVDRSPNMGTGDLWVIADNGGELNIERINYPLSMRSIPYSEHRVIRDGATMAYRVRCVLDGLAVDYSRSHKADLDNFKAEQGPNK